MKKCYHLVKFWEREQRPVAFAKILVLKGVQVDYPGKTYYEGYAIFHKCIELGHLDLAKIRNYSWFDWDSC